jgi:hypothetical protein
MPAQTVIKVRRDIAANWESVDPTLASGEIGFETDTNQLKVGNGTDEWTVLPYASGAGGASVDISETAPADPEEGDVWFNSTEGRAYIYYDSFWVDLNPGIAGPPGATGATGFVASDSEPEDTSVLWLDTDEEPDVPVPAGGSAGQLLAKVDGTDYNTEWKDSDGVRVFADAAARGSAITTPVEGMVTYLEDSDTYQSYDGSAWLPLISPGAWTSYTPTIDNLTLGNGTISARYALVGKTIFVSISLTLGSTSVFGIEPRFGWPSGISASTGNNGPLGVGTTNSISGTRYAFWVFVTASVMAPRALNSAGTYLTTNAITSTVPFTWAAGNSMLLSARTEIN